MADKKLAKALLDLGASELPRAADARDQTAMILARDRRRIRVLAVLTVFFWVTSAVALYWFIFSLIGVIYEAQQAGAKVDPATAAVHHFLLGFAGSIEALVIAVLCTLLLMFFSRRATLRQINANLIEISRQLRQAQEDGGNGANAAS